MSEEDDELEGLTEEEKKKLKTNVKVVYDKDGNPLISLDEPVFPKKAMQFFPFSQLMDMKQGGMKKVMEEMRNRFAIPPNQHLPFERFDIFIIDLRKPKPEKDEDDCESE